MALNAPKGKMRDLSELGQAGIVAVTVLDRFRETHRAAKMVARLKLFGQLADTQITDEDPPVVQILKEYARLYQKATLEGDEEGKASYLRDMSKVMVGFSSKEESTLAQAVKLVIEKAKQDVKTKEEREMTEAELIAHVNED